MRVELPIEVETIIKTLEMHGYEAFAVGGCVRDTLLCRTPGDWDITTSAKPEEVKALFTHTVDTGIAHGTVTVILHRIGYEVTTYRIDGEYEDARHPKEVTFTSNLIEDLKRRDFTINAMAYNERAGLVDAFDGIGDLERKVIRCVGNPMERFSEDALRMLRAVRFAAQLGFSIEEETQTAIRKLAPNLAKVSKERIAVEWIKILCSDHPEAIRIAYALGLTKVFLPEFDVAMEMPQWNKHHSYTVGEHSILAMQYVAAQREIRLIMLLHDLAKPITVTRDEDETAHFEGHAQAGAELSKKILRRLKFDNATIDLVSKMIRYHDERPPIQQKALVRKCISQIGLEYMPMMIAIKRADIFAQSEYKRKEKLAYVDALEEAYLEIQAQHECVSKKDLSVNGKDLIAMGMQPGEQLGKVLDLLFEEVLKEPQLNEREKLLAYANKLVAPFIR